MFRAGATIHEALAGEPQGSTERFRVGVSGVVGRTTTTDFFSPMFDIDARILSIRSGEAHDLLRELRDGGLELVLIESEPPASARTGLEVVRFDRPVLVAVTSPSAKAATDWANLGLVSLRSSTEFRWDVSAYLDARQLRPRIVAEADDVVFLIEAVTRDGYVAFLPHSIARDAIKAGRLKVLATLRGSQATVFAVYR